MNLMRFLSQININPDDVHINKAGATGDTLTNGLRLVFGAAGAVAVLIIAIAGLRYVVSQGNPAETAKAKDAILYALLGLVICIFAFTITGFVAGRL